MSRRGLNLLAAACAVIGACTSPGAQAARPATRNVILADDIARVGATNALEAIQRLQPRMLAKQRGPSSITFENQTQIAVYLDGTRFGGIETLSLIEATPILEIRFLSASEATFRFGTGNSGGAIVITTRT
jgi:hypothetical protein